MDISFLTTLREYYGLNYKLMNKLFGFGADTWQKYEKGLRPKKSHRLMIMLAMDPINMHKLVDFLMLSYDFLPSEDQMRLNIYKKVTEANNAINMAQQGARTHLVREWMEQTLGGVDYDHVDTAENEKLN